MKDTKYLIPIFMLCLLAACRTGKDYHRPAMALPERYSASGAVDTASIATISRQHFFADSLLQKLIDTGLAYNHDLQFAIRNIDIAGAQLKQARHGQLPELNFLASGQYNNPSKNSLTGLSTSSFLGSDHVENYSAGLNLSWELDIWGKIRRQKEAARAQYLGTYEAVKAVQTQLVASIADGYYNLLMLDKQLETARRNLSLSDSFLVFTRLLKEAGSINMLAVQQAEAQKQSIALLVPRLEQEIAIGENTLRILTGQFPGNVRRKETEEPFQAVHGFSAGFPAAIISGRPDIRAREMDLVAANARAGVAQANMYPSLSITGAGGVESFKASNWFNIPGSLFGIVTGSLAQPILNRRALRTRLEIARTEREQSVIRFRQAVITAVGEVSSALVQIEKLGEQQQVAAAQAAISREAVTNARLLFKSDMANYLEVITAESSALQAELSQASIQRQQLSVVVELYRALGGGWK